MDQKGNQRLVCLSRHVQHVYTAKCACVAGIDDLHNFVSVALHTTAGEADYDSDRLSNLKKVGNGFRPLIFDSMTDKSFEAFRKGCLTVWEVMETAPDLPEKLVSVPDVIVF